MRAIVSIARATIQSLARDRIFHAALVLNILFLFFAAFLSTLTVTEHRKILLDFGFAAASLVGNVFAIFLGSSFVRKELDARTIYTLLSKPVTRGQYLWGKLIGGLGVVIALQAISYLTLILALRSQGEGPPEGFLAVVYLSSLEALLFMAIGLSVSLVCSSLFLGATLTFAVFLVGRNAFVFHQYAEKTEGAMRWLMEFLYIVFPAGQRFDIRDVVAYGRPYPESMVGETTLYFFCYLLLVMALGVMAFRKKDLP